VAGKATLAAAQELAALLRSFASEVSGVPAEQCVPSEAGVDCAGELLDFGRLAAAAAARGTRLVAEGRWGGTPRSVAFNVHGFRVAVHSGTGELAILQSVQAADAGRVANPVQCRGQVEGGAAQAIGAALCEEARIDAEGRVENPAFRHYHIPASANLPRTEVLFADTSDRLSPFGAKAMSESPFNPVAPALANAVADAIGIRCRDLPLAPDRVFRALASARRREAEPAGSPPQPSPETARSGSRQAAGPTER
ncbi:MAG: xanthine dehydrogenase family protein molybdopterin-binding subunit, partial [Acetobacteraceae bacterium]|nr:xanthine dehydrogenase family protein molybdopterin-binding subunit [Acetobacteraceae bacterium]